MGPPDPPNTTETTRQMLAAYQQALPGLMQATDRQLLPAAQAQQTANASVAPQDAQTNLDIFSKYAPAMNAIGANINNANMLAQSQGNLANITGVGGQAATAAENLDKSLNPEYYATRANVSSQLGNLLSGMDPNKLSGSEEAEVERGLNRVNNSGGNSNNPSSINTVNNAMTFGNALNTKRTALEQALQTATSFLPQSQTNFASTASPSVPTNTGASNFTGVNQNAGSSANSFGSQLLGGTQALTQQNQTIKANLPSFLDNVESGTRSAGNLTNVCCFIFLESYFGVMPSYIRKLRDHFYDCNPLFALGYKRLSKLLIPLMVRYSLIRALISLSMVRPITYLGGWMSSKNKLGFIMYPVLLFWLLVWDILALKPIK